MVMQNYSPEFKADAVALYQSRPDTTLESVAADLGISRETLRGWVRAAGASRPQGRRSTAPSTATVSGPGPAASPEAEVAALRRRVRELEEERDILRKAAKYFAGETRW
jgi:transposase